MAKYLNLAGLTAYDSKIKAYLNNKVSTDLANYYNKTQVDEMIGSVAHLKLEVVSTLPTEDIKTDTIYLAPKTKAGESNTYDEYVYANGKWEKIGDTEVDLSAYAKSADVAATYATKAQVKEVEDVNTNQGTRLSALEGKWDDFVEAGGGEPNVIESVKVNGTALPVSDKSVNIDLANATVAAAGKATNDGNGQNIASTYATKGEVEEAIGSVHTHSNKTVLDNTTASYTTEEKSKLAGIEAEANKYVHPSHTAKTSGLYKVTVDAQGHVSAATPVAKSDITGLGIPAQDTTYVDATASASGLMSSADKTKVDGVAAGATADSAIDTADINALFE